MEKQRTARGFRIYDNTIQARNGTLRVQESSLAFEGAHVWLFYDDNDKRHKGKDYPAPQINVAAAKKLVSALQSFIEGAEAGELIEPAEYKEEEEELE
jgi:hypothetical protein